MRILVISDIHANLTALEAVLNTTGQVDATWCLGDVVGYGPDPNECIKRLSEQPNLVCLLGNHDSAALGLTDLNAFNRDARTSAMWTKSVLNHNSKQFLSALPEKMEEAKITLVHGSPRNPVWEYILDSTSAELNFAALNTPLCLIGHSHLPVAFFYSDDHPHITWQMLREDQSLKLESRAFLNPGSVGQPRDHDPRASYAIFDPQEHTWTNYRVSYDVAAVHKRIRQAGLPIHHANRLLEGW